MQMKHTDFLATFATTMKFEQYCIGITHGSVTSMPMDGVLSTAKRRSSVHGSSYCA